MRPIASFLLLSCVACVSYVKPLPALDKPAAAERLDFSEKARVVKLSKVFFDLPQGYRYGEVRFGFDGFCRGRPLEFANQRGPHERDVEDFADAFARTLKQHGYPVEEPVVFRQSGQTAANVLVAARIVEEAFNKCYPNVGQFNGRTRGGAYLKIEWSLYSTTEQKVILSRVTEGTTYGEMESEVGEVGILRTAFADAAERLAQDPAYRTAIDPGVVASAPKARIRVRRLPESVADLQDTLPAIRRAVVAIAGDEEGAGFAFAAPAWILTSGEVVGASRVVRVTTADGSRCYGEVVAASRVRDLALVEARCPAVKPLALATRQVASRAQVAVLHPPTVAGSAQVPPETGVAKGTRSILGMTYVESDVKVLPADAGGPLLDVYGNVVGILSRATAAEAERAGLNFFVPIADVPRYLPIDFE